MWFFGGVFLSQHFSHFLFDMNLLQNRSIFRNEKEILMGSIAYNHFL